MDEDGWKIRYCTLTPLYTARSVEERRGIKYCCEATSFYWVESEEMQLNMVAINHHLSYTKSNQLQLLNNGQN